VEFLMTRYALLPLGLLMLTGCTIKTHTGPARTETFAVERDKSEFLRVNLNMKAGELQLSGGAAKFAEGRVNCNLESCKPVVRYSSVAGRGNLTIEQPSATATLGDAKNDWEVRLPNDVPMDLTVDFGAGEANLDGGSLSLRSVEVRMGAGRLEMDLRGRPTRNYDVRVRGGVGEAIIRLPKDVGIYATAKGGIGSINVSGLRQVGDHWINDAYENATRTIRVDVQGGVGEISLIAD
jgi:hypothetical protein